MLMTEIVSSLLSPDLENNLKCKIQLLTGRREWGSLIFFMRRNNRTVLCCKLKSILSDKKTVELHCPVPANIKALNCDCGSRNGNRGSVKETQIGDNSFPS